MYRLYYLILLLVLCCSRLALADTDLFTQELEKALRTSDKIASAQQAYLSAREDVTLAKAGREWTSRLAFDNRWANRKVDGGDYNRNDSQNLTLNVEKKFYDGGVGSAQQTVAMISLNLAIQQINMTEQNVLLEAIRTYTGLAQAYDRVAINRANLNRLDEYLKAAQLQLDLGEITPTDFAGSRARYARAHAGLIQAEAELISQEARYRAIFGTIPSQLSLPEVSFKDPLTAAAAGDRALTDHPTYLIAQLQEQIARKSMDVLVAGIRPNLDLTLSSRATDTQSEAMDSVDHSATLTFSMPLLPSRSVYSKSRGAVADHREALFAQKDSRTATRLAAENAFRLYESTQAVIAAYQAEYDAAIIFRDGIRQEVQFGEKTILDQLDAEQDLVTAELNLLIAKHDRLDAIFTLMATMGILTAQTLGLDGIDAPADIEPPESPIVGILPVIDYSE